VVAPAPVPLSGVPRRLADGGEPCRAWSA